MLSTRQIALLNAAARDLRDGKHVPSHEFLCDNDVTLDEAYALSEHLALGATMLMQAVAESKQGGLVASVGMDRIVRAMMSDA